MSKEKSYSDKITDEKPLSAEERAAFEVSEDRRLRRLGISADANPTEIIMTLSKGVEEINERDRKKRETKTD